VSWIKHSCLSFFAFDDRFKELNNLVHLVLYFEMNVEKKMIEQVTGNMFQWKQINAHALITLIVIYVVIFIKIQTKKVSF